MDLYHLMDVQGHLIEICGSYFIAGSRLHEKPKDIYDTLKSPHNTTPVQNRDIDRNAFLDMFIKQSITTKNGFILVTLGILILTIGDLVSYFSIGTKLEFNGIVPFVIILVITLVLAGIVAVLNKRQREKARKQLL